MDATYFENYRLCLSQFEAMTNSTPRLGYSGISKSYPVHSQSLHCSYSYVLLQRTNFQNVNHNLVWRHLATGVMIESSKLIIILVVILSHWIHFLSTQLKFCFQTGTRKSIMQPENESFPKTKSLRSVAFDGPPALHPASVIFSNMAHDQYS